MKEGSCRCSVAKSYPTLQNEAKKHEKSERKHFRCGPSRCKDPGVGMTLIIQGQKEGGGVECNGGG